MDRESIDVSVRASDEGRPVLAVDASEATADVGGRLSGAEKRPLGADDTDVTFRETPGDGPGVLALADRLTGEFVFEAPLEGERVAALVEAVLATDGCDGEQFRLRLSEGGESHEFETATLLVYDAEGNLRRGRSLIPGGVEL